MSGVAEESPLVPTRRFPWTDGVLVTLVAAVISTLILLLAVAHLIYRLRRSHLEGRSILV